MKIEKGELEKSGDDCLHGPVVFNLFCLFVGTILTLRLKSSVFCGTVQQGLSVAWPRILPSVWLGTPSHTGSRSLALTSPLHLQKHSNKRVLQINNPVLYLYTKHNMDLLTTIVGNTENTTYT